MTFYSTLHSCARKKCRIEKVVTSKANVIQVNGATTDSDSDSDVICLDDGDDNNPLPLKTKQNSPVIYDDGWVVWCLLKLQNERVGLEDVLLQEATITSWLLVKVAWIWLPEWPRLTLAWLINAKFWYDTLKTIMNHDFPWYTSAFWITLRSAIFILVFYLTWVPLATFSLFKQVQTNSLIFGVLCHWILVISHFAFTLL